VEHLSVALRNPQLKRLCEALRNPECKIQSLWLSYNSLTADCTEDLVSALSTNYSLMELNLSNNDLGDSGVKRLCEALRNPECKIQSLWLSYNSLTADCTEDLVSALSTNYSLMELNLSNNDLGDSGVKRLCEALRNPECKIQRLWLCDNNGGKQLNLLQGTRAGLRVSVWITE
uniref:Uncharacterized protein n=1 Tax=Callorhinchus milii TaxID=7868 RepID=A0A4W3KHM8_CALMI